LADAEPPDDDGRSPAAEPPHADAPVTAEGGGAPAEGTAPANPSEQRARLAEDRLAEVLGAYRTLKQENEDVRERQSRNLERRFEQRRERLLLKFIDVLDNLDRALEAAQTSYAGQPLVEGMILVRTQLLQTLQDEGLDRIPVVGLPFDPAVSESVGTAPVKEAEQHHIVVKELLRGYRLNGRIARPSRVVIGVFDGPRAAEPGPVAAAATPAPPAAASPADMPAVPAPAAAPAAVPSPVPPPAAAAAPPAAPAAPSAPEDDRDPATAETARLPSPPMPPPLPPKIPPPRRKGR
jgi:molecular chaperone GrpE